MQKTTIHRIILVLALFAGGILALTGDLLGGTLAMMRAPDLEAAGAVRAEADSLTADTAEAVQDPAIELYARVGYNFSKLTPLPPDRLDSETLWLARCIYSETKRPEEQELVAWVVRNRVETAYRGSGTYREVVLDPLQFSAFNPGTRTRSFYSNLTYASSAPGWQRALRIAHDVRFADASVRPFPETTRHFYSEQSMRGQRHPNWAAGQQPVTPERPYAIEVRRFRFFADVT